MALSMSKEIIISPTKKQTSTVSKIVHQSYFQEFSVAKGHTTFTSQDASRLPTQRLDTQCALSEWFQDSHSAGIPITRAMIRKQAAIVAANTWKQNNQQSNLDESVAEDQSRCNDDAQSSSSPSSKSMYSSLRARIFSHTRADQKKFQALPATFLLPIPQYPSTALIHHAFRTLIAGTSSKPHSVPGTRHCVLLPVIIFQFAQDLGQWTMQITSPQI